MDWKFSAAENAVEYRGQQPYLCLEVNEDDKIEDDAEVATEQREEAADVLLIDLKQKFENIKQTKGIEIQSGSE